MRTPENERESITMLQRYLLQLSFHDESIPPPPVDGIFDTATKQSLTAFQSRIGLPATGRADRRTWEALYAAYRASLNTNAPPRQISVFPNLSTPVTIEQGMNGFAVSALQWMLRELSANYNTLSSVQITGTYDPPTASAVAAFQVQNGLPDTGGVDLDTWNRIADQYNIRFSLEPYL